MIDRLIGPASVALAGYEVSAWVTGWPTLSDLAARWPWKLLIAAWLVGLVWHFGAESQRRRQCCLLENV